MPDPECGWVWPDFVESILSQNGTSQYGPHGTRSVPRGAPIGRPEGAELLTWLCALPQGSALWGRPGTLGLGKQSEYAFCPCQHLYRTLSGVHSSLSERKRKIRKILVSVKFVSAILGPEMAAPILRTPGKMPSFCRKTSMSIKFLVLGGGEFGFWGGGPGKCRFYFYGREDFSEKIRNLAGPLGTPPMSLYESHAWRLLIFGDAKH